MILRSFEGVGSDEPVQVLSEDDNWRLLGSVALGRLVTNFAGEAEIFPVNFVVQDRTVLFRTAEGTKLFSAVANHAVVFEVDDHNLVEGWSVIVRGRARLLKTDTDIQRAERAQLLPWTATLKPHYVRITPAEVTGRRFRFGPEPDRHEPVA
ncbi:pyridoxamine 5'-phosphate oxidase family protein [Mycobacterium avium subsp. hominissuis]|uniref:Pyridoxamine 5'-phosphate oxidase n=1 Tax=Mycobacterium avium subsp. hominissuis TaxID=439334 RepID=A0AAI8SQ16_MYCAV|nr:pyridoxamine 5'-phosphate oxidase [Mycobacterium avium subsp. hominissuis]